MSEIIHIAIAGAAGRIGYSLIFRIAAGGMFGSDHQAVLSLQDVPDRLPLLQAEELELKTCGFPLLADVHIATDPVRAFAGADWVILVAGKHLTDWDQSHRLDLVRENAPIYVEMGRAINASCPSARILVVGSPCNTNCLIAHKHAPDVPPEHWFALNRLDRMRATSLIADMVGVPVRHVNRVVAWGNNSESVYIDVQNAFIGDRPALEIINDPTWERDVLQPAVARRGQEILRLHHHRAPAGAAAQAILGTIHSITTPTPFNRRFGAAVIATRFIYGVPPGIVFGFPLRTEDGMNWSIVEGLYLSDYAQDRLAVNVAELEFEAEVASEVLGGHL